MHTKFGSAYVYFFITGSSYLLGFFNHFAHCVENDATKLPHCDEWVGVNGDNGITRAYIYCYHTDDNDNNLIIKSTNEVLRKFEPYRSFITNINWVDGVVDPYDEGRTSTNIVTGPEPYDLHNTYDAETGKYIIVYSKYNEAGTYVSTAFDGMFHNKSSGYLTPRYDGPWPDTYIQDMCVMTDEGTEYTVFNSVDVDDMYSYFTAIYKVSDEKYAYGYSGFSTELRKLCYGFIFGGAHHRLVFDAWFDGADYTPQHFFNTATYISPNGIESIVEFPGEFMGLVGKGMQAAGSLFKYVSTIKEI